MAWLLAQLSRPLAEAWLLPTAHQPEAWAMATQPSSRHTPGVLNIHLVG